ncbi:DoxX family protein [Paenibacillus humicola]|uniref:DoxX family protein n=1 Tax=Paenibacillus humicola TaxID=3110540 RepID=UPI00237B41C8|nr:DoxX family protein [Paenibacillus humicola]
MDKTNSSKGRIWAARIMSAIVILFMLFDGISKLIKPEPVVEGTLKLGFAQHHIALIGVLALISAVLFAVPRTSFLGALLLTGFFGGAMAANFRVDAPLFGNILFPVYLAVLAWGALWLRNDSFRRLLSGRSVR